jgi:hypothetical protein
MTGSSELSAEARADLRVRTVAATELAANMPVPTHSGSSVNECPEFAFDAIKQLVI